MYSFIEDALDAKLNEWLGSLPEELATYLGDKTFIAGGAIASLIAQETPRDYDIFFTTPGAVISVVAHYNMEAIMSISTTINAITVGDIQLITRRYGSPELITSQFDWVHTMGYYYRGELIIPDIAYSATLAKKLVYNRTCLYPFHALSRIAKFARRGFTVDVEDLQALARDLQNIDPDDPDQLAGLYPYDL